MHHRLNEQLRRLREESRAAAVELQGARRRITKLEEQVDDLTVTNSEANWEIESLRRAIDWRAHADPATDRELFAGEVEGYGEAAAVSLLQGARGKPPPACAPEPPRPDITEAILGHWVSDADSDEPPNTGLNRAARRRLQRQKRRR